jgi:hypothetical protein
VETKQALLQSLMGEESERLAWDIKVMTGFHARAQVLIEVLNGSSRFVEWNHSPPNSTLNLYTTSHVIQTPSLFAKEDRSDHNIH